MIDSSVKPGTSTTIYYDFLTPNRNVIAMTEAVTYDIRNENQALVLAGTAEQTSQPQRWQALIVIPEGLPPGRYTLNWYAKTKKKELERSEVFNIAEVGPRYTELDLLVPERSIVTDTLRVDRSEVITDIAVSVMTPEGVKIFEDDLIGVTPFVQGNQKVYQFNSAVPLVDMVAGNSAFALYLIEWTYNSDGEPQREHNFMYVVNHKVLAYVNELRRMIDKSGITRTNPRLRYNNVDLVAYLNLGLQWLNAQPPLQTGYTLGTVPDSLFSYVLNAGAREALESRLIAEGEAAFTFDGQPIQLTVDRTGFLESAIGRYDAKLANINTIKKGIAMGGGGGSPGYGSAGGGDMGYLGYSVGPTLTLSPFGFNSRSPIYAGILHGLGYPYY